MYVLISVATVHSTLNQIQQHLIFLCLVISKLNENNTMKNKMLKITSIQLRIAHDKTKYTSYIVKKRNL